MPDSQTRIVNHGFIVFLLGLTTIRTCDPFERYGICHRNLVVLELAGIIVTVCMIHIGLITNVHVVT